MGIKKKKGFTKKNEDYVFTNWMTLKRETGFKKMKKKIGGYIA